MTKLSLSAEELILVNNTDWILSKHRIVKNIYEFLGTLLPKFEQEVIKCSYLFPDNIQYQTGKISRGENYRLLPYVILDYPAFFWKNNILAIRTMFWWGNFFSITLHLSGINKNRYTSNQEQIFEWLKLHDYSVCDNIDEWEHHSGTGNYRPAKSVSDIEFAKILAKDFYKMAKFLPLTDYSNAEVYLLERFREILNFLQLSYQGDEINLSPVFPITGSGL